MAWGEGLMKGLVCGSLILSGCTVLSTVGISSEKEVAPVSYVNAELETTYSASFDKTWQASLDALSALGAQERGTKRNEFSGVISASTADGAAVELTLAAVGPAATLAKIRVGDSGDEQASRAIHLAILSRLKGTKASSHLSPGARVAGNARLGSPL